MSRLGEKLSGSAKEFVGEITDNDRLKIKGKLGHMAANMKDWADDARDAVTGRIHGAEAHEDKSDAGIHDMLDDPKMRTEKIDDEM